ncbi:MAG: flagellar biosynthesis protein FlhF [Planctomycetales bacterium 12-60-4]|nr:MAG: flagellar biosynthesis protein FlhF [Planctomycetales bacterium 12-60-4]
MTTDVRTFRAANMQAALDVVRREMGHEAVILHTRHIDKRGLLSLFSKRQEVEITAGLGAQLRPAKPSAGTIAAAKVNKSTARTDDLAAPPPLLAEKTDNERPPARPSIADTVRSLAEQTVAKSSDGPRNTVVPPRWSPNDVIVDLPFAGRPANSASSPQRSGATRFTVARNDHPPKQTRNPSPKAETIASRSRSSNVSGEPADSQAIHQRLDTLQRMILELGRERPDSSLQDIPTELFQVYTQLLDNEVDEILARELVLKAKKHATKGQLSSPSAMQALLAGLVEQELHVGPPLKSTRGRRRVAALVGPTGVGKTTTLAKLAANLRLRDGLKVGLITVDTYRIAAVEQLKTYAELIDLPMKIVSSAAEMRTALDELNGLDLVLIDTAGRSPRDELKIRELKECLDAAQADEVHLVLSLSSGLPALESVAASFKSVGVNSLILTKLDEATGAGLPLQIARLVRMPVSYLTTGQNVPDDIEPAHRTRMARLVLGIDRIG